MKKMMMTVTKTCNPQTPAVLVIVAAGSSSRMGGIKKEYLPMNGGTVLSCVARIFLESYNFKAVAIAIPKDGENDAKKALFSDKEISTLLNDTNLLFVPGGKTRQESVLNALEALKPLTNDNTLVAIHDGARPFVSSQIILQTIEAAQKHGAAVPGLQPVDTQKEINCDGIIVRHLQRENLSAVQTPQIFKFKPLLEAHRKALTDSYVYTDDTEIWGKYCGDVKITEGSSENKKITYPSDIPNNKTKENKMIRVGLGYDLHALVEGRKLVLGGVHIPFEKGEAGHSDGDVLLHALTDALLGAAGLGDIGSFFPPEEAKWKDADSSMLLKTVWKKIKEDGWKLVNADCVIALEKPKFIPYRQEVIKSISKILEVEENQIFVKAKTGEKMGKIGRGEAVEVWANCLLEK